MNIILVGMPASGKSTFGKKLAHILNMNWVDTDDFIIEKYGPLKTLIAENRLIECEEDAVTTYDTNNTIISTGGSVPLHKPTINHLKKQGIVVWLDIPISIIKRRIGDPQKRGVLMGDAKNIKQLYEYRKPFYKDCADLIVTKYDVAKIQQFYNEQCELQA